MIRRLQDAVLWCYVFYWITAPAMLTEILSSLRR